MAEPFDTLMEVQQHDTALDQLRRRKEALPERVSLAESGRRRAELDRGIAEVEAQVDDLAGRQRAIEEHIEATTRRRHEIEQRMQSGAVSASRDLQAMDHEVHQLADRQARLEEDELALLEEQEPLDTRLAQDRAARAALVAAAEQLSSAIAEAEAEIDEAIVAEAALRDALAPRLPVELAERYEVLRARSGWRRRGQAGRGPVRRMSSDAPVGRGRADPPAPARRIRHVPPVRPHPGALIR